MLSTVYTVTQFRFHVHLLYICTYLYRVCIYLISHYHTFTCTYTLILSSFLFEQSHSLLVHLLIASENLFTAKSTGMQGTSVLVGQFHCLFNMFLWGSTDIYRCEGNYLILGLGMRTLWIESFGCMKTILLLLFSRCTIQIKLHHSYCVGTTRAGSSCRQMASTTSVFTSLREGEVEAQMCDTTAQYF